MTFIRKIQKVETGRQRMAVAGSARAVMFALLISAFCLLPSAFCLPPDNGRPTYESFRLVHTRNIFDPDRHPARPSTASTPAATSARVEYVALTGIAVDGEKSLAFFSGSRAEFNKVVPIGGKVAEATLTKITPLNIEVDRGSRHLIINVGQTVPLDDKSSPAAAPTDQPAASPAAPSSATGTTPAASSPAAGSTPAANLDEIRRRMMERHNQDQK